MAEFDVKAFVDTQVKEIKKTIGDERALVAVSGGVDSTTCAVLTHLSIGDNLSCVTIDDGFRRQGEPETVVDLLSGPSLNLPVKVLRVEERFMTAVKGLRDAEEKRKAFRDVFYRTLGDAGEAERTRYLVQGTILADILETKGGIKTQHNVLDQIGINAFDQYGFRVVEPLISLYKHDVRKVARYLKIPPEISERQPFPGPGLLVRVVGEVRKDKLETLKEATAITEKELAKYKPSQYFATVVEDREQKRSQVITEMENTISESLKTCMEDISLRLLEDKATGIKQKTRQYGDILTIDWQGFKESHMPSIRDLVLLQEKIVRRNPSITRVLFGLSSREKKPYVVAIRAVESQDFITAAVSDIPWTTLFRLSRKIVEDCPNVSTVYYDVTPKPPATIEME